MVENIEKRSRDVLKAGLNVREAARQLPNRPPTNLLDQADFDGIFGRAFFNQYNSC